MCGVIVVDAESIGLLVSDVMPICMIIALDIVMTLRGSINCSIVICSPTVILAILREASSEHYGPRVYSTPYFQPYTFSSFHFPPSYLTLQSILKGFTTPLQRWVGALCVCAGTLDLTRFSYWIDTLVLKLREILTAAVLHHPFLFKGTPTQGSKAAGKSFAYLPRKSLKAQPLEKDSWRRC